MKRIVIMSWIVLLTQIQLSAGELYEAFPKAIDSDQKYVFYSHGYIVEGDNPTPEHPQFGVYQFPAIKQALAEADVNLIAYHRPAKTNPKAHAEKLVQDVEALMTAGVKEQNITLLGFSRGGFITAMASSQLGLKNLNTIIMASCGRWIERMPEIKLSGRVLSLYETSDRVGSCQRLIDRSPEVTSFKEVAISTGKSHGAFFTPDSRWLDVVIQWIES